MSQERRSLSGWIFDSANSLFIMFLMILMLYPFWYMIAGSLSDPVAIFGQRGLLLWPKGFSLDAYRAVFGNKLIWSGYRNTLLYLVAGTTVNLLLTAFGAYALSRRGVYFRNLIMGMIVFTMFFDGGLIPRYFLVYRLGLIDNRLALILPGAIGTMNMIIMRTAFAGISESMEESARIDGANDFTILFRIMIPIAMPVVAVMILFYGVGHWNAWFDAMIYLSKRNLYPLQLVLREILINHSTDMTTGTVGTDVQPIGETIKFATIIVATVPVLVIYPFLQRYFVKGVMIGSLKE
ncbi:MAG: carbohydrate ABC transporter permease [Bacteroidota bacterium]